MGTMTRIHSVPLDPTSATLDSLEHTYQDHMREGAKLLNLAALMRREADKCVLERSEMKESYRDTRDTQLPGVDQMISDHRAGGFKIMKDAKDDWLYYTRRALTYSQEAAAQFAAAAAWMQYIDRMRVRSE